MSDIRCVQIFGERWSGTSYIEALIRINFESVAITRKFGWKHWFIKDHQPRCEPNETTDFECVETLDNSDGTAFIVITRNPYDWLRSMMVNPYHAPHHAGVGFSRFIRAPWKSWEKHRANSLWPESPQGSYLIETADNILKLRSMKIEHWLNLADRVSRIEFVRYESLRDDINRLREIGSRLGLPVPESDLQNEIRYCVGSSTSGKPFHPRLRPPIDRADLDFIRAELDWDLEEKVGYGPEDYQADL